MPYKYAQRVEDVSRLKLSMHARYRKKGFFHLEVTSMPDVGPDGN